MTSTETIVGNLYQELLLFTIPRITGRTPLGMIWSRADHHDKIVAAVAKRCGMSEDRVREIVDDA